MISGDLNFDLIKNDLSISHCSHRQLWVDVSRLRCSVLCCRLVEKCSKLSQLSLNAHTNISQNVLDGLQKWLGTDSDGRPRFFEFRVPGR